MKNSFILIQFLLIYSCAFGQNVYLQGTWEGFSIRKNIIQERGEQWIFKSDGSLTINIIKEDKIREWNTFNYSIKDNNLLIGEPGEESLFELRLSTKDSLIIHSYERELSVNLSKISSRSTTSKSSLPLETLVVYDLQSTSEQLQHYTLEYVSIKNRRWLNLFKNGEWQSTAPLVTIKLQQSIFYVANFNHENTIRLYLNALGQISGSFDEKIAFDLKKSTSKQLLSREALLAMNFIPKTYPSKELDYYQLESNRKTISVGYGKLKINDDGSGEQVVYNMPDRKYIERSLNWQMSTNGCQIYILSVENSMFNSTKINFEVYQLKVAERKQFMLEPAFREAWFERKTSEKTDN